MHHWCDGGPTCLSNTCLVCEYRHRLIHHGGWQVVIFEGLPCFTAPSWIDPEQQPIPGSGQ